MSHCAKARDARCIAASVRCQAWLLRNLKTRSLHRALNENKRKNAGGAARTKQAAPPAFKRKTG
jgi:hypothetical protein